MTDSAGGPVSILDVPEGGWEMLRTNHEGEKRSPQGISYVAWDIETVQDPDMPTPEEVYTAKGWEIPERGLFPSAAQSMVVSATAVALDDKFIPRQFLIFGRGKGESGIVWDFMRYLRESPILKLISWNGRRFDMPVMVARALAHGWPAEPWLRYRYRYVDMKDDRPIHIDLMDQLADYGGGRNLSLDLTCKMCGLPGKMEAAGDDVQSLFDAGKQAEIDDYCLTDSLQTAFLFQRVMMLVGKISRTEYRFAAEQTLKTLRDYQGVTTKGEMVKGRPSHLEGVDVGPFLLKINQQRLLMES